MSEPEYRPVGTLPEPPFLRINPLMPRGPYQLAALKGLLADTEAQLGRWQRRRDTIQRQIERMEREETRS